MGSTASTHCVIRAVIVVMIILVGGLPGSAGQDGPHQPNSQTDAAASPEAVYADCVQEESDAAPGRFARVAHPLSASANASLEIAQNRTSGEDNQSADRNATEIQTLLEPHNATPPQHILTFQRFPANLTINGSLMGARVIGIYAPLCFVVVETSDAAFAERASKLPGIVGVDANGHVTLSRVSTDWGLSSQHGLMTIRAPEAWDTSFGTHTKKGCIVDSGLYIGHSDHKSSSSGGNFYGGFNYAANPANSNPTVSNGANAHGTQVAGIFAASTNDAFGMSGVGNLGFFMVRVDVNALNNFDQVAAGIDWCRLNGGDVIVLSLETSSDVTVIRNAVNAAIGAGKIVVAAAGNTGGSVQYPAKYSGVVAVSCFTVSRTICSSSSRGSEIDLAAPGSQIFTTGTTHSAFFETVTGTSFAAPHVAGVAAYVWSVHSGKTASQIITSMKSSAQPIVGGSSLNHGSGMVDLKATLDHLGPGIPSSGYQSSCDIASNTLYSCAPSSSFSWISIPSPSSVSLSSNAQSSAIPLPFPFLWHGVPRLDVKIASNGYLCFGTDSCTTSTAQAVPSQTAPNDLMACFWENLAPQSTSAIRYGSATSGGQSVFVVEFFAVPHSPNKGGNTFQMHLFDDNTVRCSWLAVSNDADGARTTVGIESPLGVTGVRHMNKEFSIQGRQVTFHSLL